MSPARAGDRGQKRPKAAKSGQKWPKVAKSCHLDLSKLEIGLEMVWFSAWRPAFVTRHSTFTHRVLAGSEGHRSHFVNPVNSVYKPARSARPLCDSVPLWPILHPNSR